MSALLMRAVESNPHLRTVVILFSLSVVKSSNHLES
jgi:hypothetical protein